MKKFYKVHTQLKEKLQHYTSESIPGVLGKRVHWQNIEGKKGTWAYFMGTGEQSLKNREREHGVQIY